MSTNSDCCGFSETLGIGANVARDTAVIRTVDYGGGMVDEASAALLNSIVGSLLRD